MSSVNSQNFQARLGVILDSIEDPGHREVVLDYVEERRANGIRVSTLIANANVLRTYANGLGKPFIEATRRDLNAYCNNRRTTRVYRSTNNEGETTKTYRDCTLSDATIDHHKVVLRGFYKWLNNGEYPESVKHLKTRTGKKPQLSTDRLVTREEIAALIQAAGEPRLRALIAVLYETGFRAGEIVALNVGSAAFDEIGCTLKLPDTEGLKTGTRSCRILRTESSPHLLAWYEMHPLKHDPTAPLFPGASRRNPLGRMLPSSLYAVVKGLTKRAGIGRHIKPHDFRHTAATEKARLGYNEAQLRWYFGWSRTSDMPSHYVHLAGADYEAMMLEKHGIVVEAERERPVMHAPCPHCETVNDTTNTYCQACQRPLKPTREPVELQNEALMAALRDMVESRVKELQADV